MANGKGRSRGKNGKVRNNGTIVVFGAYFTYSFIFTWLVCGFQRMLWPAPRRNTSIVLTPSLLSTHNWCSWSLIYTCLTHLRGNSPQEALSRAVLTCAESTLRIENPIKCSIGQFQALHRLLLRCLPWSVTWCAFHMAGGNSGGLDQRTMIFCPSSVSLSMDSSVCTAAVCGIKIS